MEERFDDRYLSTIGAKVSRASVTLPDDSLDMLIWDLAGSERFDALMRSYDSGAAGALLVCDLTRPETATAVVSYAQQFWLVNPRTPLLLLGNKADLAEPGMLTAAEVTAIAASINATALLTSAKTGANVQAAFQLLAQQLVAPQPVA